MVRTWWKGAGKQHAKFSPVSVCSFWPVASVEFNDDAVERLSPEEAAAWCRECPAGGVAYDPEARSAGVAVKAPFRRHAADAARRRVRVLDATRVVDSDAFVQYAEVLLQHVAPERLAGVPDPTWLLRCARSDSRFEFRLEVPRSSSPGLTLRRRPRAR